MYNKPRKISVYGIISGLYLLENNKELIEEVQLDNNFTLNPILITKC